MGEAEDGNGVYLPRGKVIEVVARTLGSESDVSMRKHRIRLYMEYNPENESMWDDENGILVAKFSDEKYSVAGASKFVCEGVCFTRVGAYIYATTATVVDVTVPGKPINYASLKDAVEQSTNSLKQYIFEIFADQVIGAHNVVEITNNQNIIVTRQKDASAKIYRKETYTGSMFVVMGTLSLNYDIEEITYRESVETLDIFGSYESDDISQKIDATNAIFRIEKNGCLNIFEGVTIQNGTNISSNGGAVYIQDRESTFNMFSGTIKNCSAINGGAIAIKAGTAQIISGVLSDNNANNGGAIYSQGALNIGSDSSATLLSENFASENGGAIYQTAGTILLKNSTFTGNSANNGGAIYICDEGSIDIQDSAFTENSSSYGGAVYAIGQATIIGCSFSKNGNSVDTTCNAGGAVYFAGKDTKPMEVKCSTFAENSANSGGAVYVKEGEVTIHNTNEDNTGYITGNTATYGGGLYVSGGTVVVLSYTISSNTKSGEDSSFGGGVYVLSGNVSISNTEISGNTTNSGGGVYLASGRLNIRGGKISDNNADFGGGLMMVAGILTFSAYTDESTSNANVEVSNNKASLGGGLYLSGRGNEESAEIMNTDIINNTSTGYAGGIYVKGINVTLQNTQIYSNKCSSEYNYSQDIWFAGDSFMVVGAGVALGEKTDGEPTATIYISGETKMSNFVTPTATINKAFIFNSDFDYSGLNQKIYLKHETNAFGEYKDTFFVASNISRMEAHITLLVDKGVPFETKVVYVGATNIETAVASFSIPIDSDYTLRQGKSPNEDYLVLAPQAYQVMDKDANIVYIHESLQNAINASLRHSLVYRGEQLIVVINEEVVSLKNSVNIGLERINTPKDIVYIVSRKNARIVRDGYSENLLTIGKYGEVYIGTNCVNGFEKVLSGIVDDVTGNYPTITFDGTQGLGDNVSLIRNTGSLTLGENVILSNNNLSSIGNQEKRNGGAVVTLSTDELYNARLAVCGAKFSNNSANGNGGAISMEQGSLLSFESGLIEENRASFSGGGILIDNARATISSGVIKKNVAGQLGGGIAVRNGGILDLVGGVEVSNNSAKNGGGISLFKSGEITTKINKSKDRVSICDNTATSGGGVFVASSPVDNEIVATITLGGVDIKNNKATKYGGGVCITTLSKGDNESNAEYHGVLKDSDGKKLLCVNATIGSKVESSNGAVLEGNEAKYTIGSIPKDDANKLYGLGGGLYVLGATVQIGNTGIVSNNTKFEINYSYKGETRHEIFGGYGAGIYASYSDVEIMDSNIQSNTAAKDGGGVYVDTGASVVFSKQDSKKVSTVIQNSAENGGGIYINSPANNADIMNNTECLVQKIQIGGESLSNNVTGKGKGVYVNSSSDYRAFVLHDGSKDNRVVGDLSSEIKIYDVVYLAPYTFTNDKVEERRDAVIHVSGHYVAGATVNIALADDIQKARGHIIATYICNCGKTDCNPADWADERLFVTEDLVNPYCFIAKDENVVVGIKVVLRENEGKTQARFFESLESAFDKLEKGNWTFVILRDLKETTINSKTFDFTVKSSITIKADLNATVCSGELTDGEREWVEVIEDGTYNRKIVKVNEEKFNDNYIFNNLGNLTIRGVVFDGNENVGIVTNDGDGASTTIINSDIQGFKTTAITANAGTVNITNSNIQNCESNIVTITDNATLNMSNCVVKNNQTGTNSVVVIASSVGNTITSCEFTNNSCTGYGGAITNKGSLTISASTFTRNSTGAVGGAIYSSGILIIAMEGEVGCVFTNNKASESGGAIYATQDLTITGAIFDGNTASANGGAICVVGEETKNLTLNNVEITNSYKVESGAKVKGADNGGGLYADKYTISFNGKNTISGNRAINGGGMYLLNCIINTSSGSNVKITSNFATNGGGIYITKSSTTASSTTTSDTTTSDTTNTVALHSEIVITSNTASLGNGGGVYVGGGNATIGGATISNNIAKADVSTSSKVANCTTGFGGGIYVDSGAVLNVSSGMIGSSAFEGNVPKTPNKALYGAGIYSAGTTNISGGSIQGNIAIVDNQTVYTTSITESFKTTGKAMGGGVYGGANTLTVRGGSISNNFADYGGGIYLAGVLELSDGSISKNTAGFGAGLYVNSENATLSGGSITENTAKYTIVGEENKTIEGGFGGGVYVAEGKKFALGEAKNKSTESTAKASASSTTTSISKNSAYKGGGVYVAGSKDESTTIFTLNQATIGGKDAGNTAIYGGGVYVDVGIKAEYEDGVFKGNKYYPGKLDIQGGTISYNNAINLPEDIKDITLEQTPSGGGIYCKGTLNISGATISNNSAVGSGAGIFFTNRSVESGINGTSFSLSIKEGTTFSSNSAETAGAIYMQTKGDSGLYTLSNCTFSGNNAKLQTGAVQVEGSAIFADCTFTKNMAGQSSSTAETRTGESSSTAGSRGGALYIQRLDNAPNYVKINDCIFGRDVDSFGNYMDRDSKGESLGNKAKLGGAIYVHGEGKDGTLYDSKVEIYGTTIANNGEGTNDDSFGGGVYIENSTVTFGSIKGGKNNTLSNNKAGNGGAIAFTCVTATKGNENDGTLTISDGTSFTSNIATNGGALYVGSGNVEIISGIFGYEDNSSIDYYYSGKYEEVEGKLGYSYNKSDKKIHIKFEDITELKSSIAIQNTLGNQATSGGAIYLAGGNLTIGESSKIIGNHAGDGGALYVAEGTANILANQPNTTESSDDSKILTGNLIANFAKNGGAVYIKGGVLNVGGTFNDKKYSGYICNNYALRGGAIYGNESATINLTFGGIYNNRAIMEMSNESLSYGQGGGVYVTGNTTLEVKNFIIQDNNAYSGGGLYLNGGTITIKAGNNSETETTKICENIATRDGGGIYVNSSAKLEFGGARILNNTAGEYGGGICMVGGNITQDNGRGSVKMGGNSAIYGGAVAVMYGEIKLSRFFFGGVLFETQIVDDKLVPKLEDGKRVILEVIDEDAIKDIKDSIQNETLYWANIATFGGAVYLENGKFEVEKGGSATSENVTAFIGQVKGVGDSSSSIVSSGNIASSGGGVFVAGGTFSMSGGVIIDNYAVGVANVVMGASEINSELKNYIESKLNKGNFKLLNYWGGGAICQVAGAVEINRTTIQNNRTEGFGGAILSFSNLRTTIVEGNVEGEGANHSKLSAEGAIISNNTASQKVYVFNNVASGSLMHLNSAIYKDGNDRTPTTDGIVSVNALIYLKGGTIQGRMAQTSDKGVDSYDSLSLYLLGIPLDGSNVGSYASENAQKNFIDTFKSEAREGKAEEKDVNYLKSKYANHYYFTCIGDYSLPYFYNNIVIGKYIENRDYCSKCNNTRQVPCEVEDGHTETTIEIVTCEDCGGTGSYEDEDGNNVDCPVCEGSGTIEVENHCSLCGGDGWKDCPECSAQQPYIQINARKSAISYQNIQYLNNLPIDFVEDYASRHYAFGWTNGVVFKNNAVKYRKPQRPNLIIGYTEERTAIAKVNNRNFENCYYMSHEDGVWRVMRILMKKTQEPFTCDPVIMEYLGGGLADLTTLLPNIPEGLGVLGSSADILFRAVALINRIGEIDWGGGVSGSLTSKTDTIENWKKYMRVSPGDYVDVGPIIEDIIKLSGDVLALFPALAVYVKPIILIYDSIKTLIHFAGQFKYVSCAST